MKSIYFLVGFLLIGVIFVSGCTSSSENNQGNSKTFSSCESLIPDRIKLNCGNFIVNSTYADGSVGADNGVIKYQCYNVGYRSLYTNDLRNSENELFTYYWNDGSNFSLAGPFEKATQPSNLNANKNINYVYIQAPNYEKQNIDADGTIHKSTTYHMNFAIDPNDKTDEGYKIVQTCCSEPSALMGYCGDWQNR